MAAAHGSENDPLGTRPRRLLIVTAPLALAGLAAIAFSLAAAGAASAPRRLPARNTSGRTNCSVEPSRPVEGQGSVYGGGRSGGGFPIVGSIDANGCNSWTYEHAGSFGPDTSFFAGAGFQAGQQAYQDSTLETTELLDGHQLIRVVDPTPEWLRVYQGYDVCSQSGPRGSTATCIAPAPESLPDDWVIYIPVAVLLGAMVVFLVHFLRPAGPVRRPRHYRRVHQELRRATPRDSATQLEGVDIRQLQKRLRRLERSMSPELSESQRHWFSGLLASGRHGMALESLARWMAETDTPITSQARDEALWLASSLKIEREVRPVLDAQVFAHDYPGGPPDAPTTGFDVPLADFTQLVSEAVDSLPPAFGKAMTNVAIVVEEEGKSADQFGCYQGHPLTSPRYRTWLLHPDKITIYRKTICAHCHSRDEVTAMVYRVVIHEIAHHFGIDDPRLRELGW